jgi:cathepsin L
MKVLVIIAVFFTASVAAAGIQSEWISFKLKFNKKYKDLTEDSKREKIFKINKDAFERHNELFRQGKVSYEKGLNEFSDMTDAELDRILNGHKMKTTKRTRRKRSPVNTSDSLPKEMDWRIRGAVTSVKKQSSCGSCYAFSAVGAIEGQYFLKTDKLQSFSVQQVVDCSIGFGIGCMGGEPSEVFKYVAKNIGLQTEKSYPYWGIARWWCLFEKEKAEVFIEDFELLDGSEEALKEAVATIGPISVAIHASTSFLTYDRGIYNESNCKGTLNHAVLVVGYGSENGRDYWIVKNSHGSKWGEKGYIRMTRNRNNQCGIATEAMYPTGVRGKRDTDNSSPTNEISTSAPMVKTTTTTPVVTTTTTTPVVKTTTTTPVVKTTTTTPVVTTTTTTPMVKTTTTTPMVRTTTTPTPTDQNWFTRSSTVSKCLWIGAVLILFVSLLLLVFKINE